MKKLLSIFLIVSLLVCCIPFTASATRSTTSDTPSWTFNKTTAAQGEVLTCTFKVTNFNSVFKKTVGATDGAAGFYAPLAFQSQYFEYVAGSLTALASPQATEAYPNLGYSALNGWKKVEGTAALNTYLPANGTYGWSEVTLGFSAFPTAPFITALDDAIFSFQLRVKSDAPLGAVANSVFKTYGSTSSTAGRQIAQTVRTDENVSDFVIMAGDGLSQISTDKGTAGSLSSELYYSSITFPTLTITAAGPNWATANKIKDSDPLIKYSDGWSKVTVGGFTDKSATKATSIGRTATFELGAGATALKIRSYKSKTQGAFDVYINNVKDTTVQLDAAGVDDFTDANCLVYEKTGLKQGDKIQIVTAKGTNNATIVQLDGLLVAGGTLQAVTDAGVVASKTIRYEYPLSDNTLCGITPSADWVGPNLYEARKNIVPFANKDALKLYPEAIATLKLPNGQNIPAGATVTVGSYKSPTQGTMFVQIGTGTSATRKSFAPENNNGTTYDSASSLVAYTYTADKDYPGAVLIKCLTKMVQIDYVEITLP